MGTYKQYLKVLIAEVRSKGAMPVLVTSMHRRNFGLDGSIRSTLGDYPEAVRQTAKEEDVALIDLNAMSAKFYEALGPERSGLAFGANGRDATHHSAYGAYELARCVVQGMRLAKVDLVKHLADDTGEFDPMHPDASERWKMPASVPWRRNHAARKTSGGGIAGIRPLASGFDDWLCCAGGAARDSGAVLRAVGLRIRRNPITSASPGGW